MGRADRSGAAPATVRVAVAYSPRAGEAFELDLELPSAATAWEAVQASGVLERWPGLDAVAPSIGIWGRSMPASTPLRDGDRVELYRPLAMAPGEARRLRARKAAKRG